MTKLLLIATAALSLAACASTGADKPAVCDGKHLRPANPYGTVLTTDPQPAEPAKPAASTPSAAAPLAALTLGQTFGSCGS